MTDKGWNKGCIDGQQPQGGWGRRGKRGGGRPTTKDRAQKEKMVDKWPQREGGKGTSGGLRGDTMDRKR